MPDKLVGILVCLLLANVVNYALGEWLEAQLPRWSETTESVDGSVIQTTQYYEMMGVDDAAEPGVGRLLKFYRYLDSGTTAAYADWQNDRSLVPKTGLLKLATASAASTNAVRYVALLVLIVVLILLFGGGLREESLFSPPLYLLIVSGTSLLFGGYNSWLFSGSIGLFLLLYFVSLRVFLPIYNTEWTRTMRPLLTPCLFLLAVMAWRGHELVDYWFWTSPLFRLAWVFVLLLGLYFHFKQVGAVLQNAKMQGAARIFAVGFPLGIALSVIGLVIGLYGADAGAGLIRLNDELLLFSRETVLNFNPDAPFVLFFAGAMLLIVSCIGYFIQRIAH